MTRARDLASGSGIEAGEVLPHIIPDVLYPAVANIMLDGTTSLSAVTTGPNGSTVASSKYGTVQSDGRMYYYTDIKGSKPIKDPRIGAHFGSQRHKFKSLQLLEQETATHGEDVYSIDGREWMRSVTGTIDSGQGIYWESSTVAGVVEIVGYFSDANLLAQTRDGTSRSFTWAIDGGNATTNNSLECGVESPLRGRYVDAGSVLNLGLSQTLGIHTLKLSTPAVSGDTPDLNGIELIAQDTSSDANKLKIQIPAQNVVSYGKKHAIPATAQHYDPFDGFTNGTDISGYIDEATSLGMSKWKISSTWYRPFNGGRVVKWIASDGTIKTSVTMMPPNAKSIANSASPTNAFATRTTASHYATNNPMNSFEAGTDLDVDGLSEVAKTFNPFEFGNGSANGGTEATNYADASMLSGTADDIAYVMDDGLTSFSGNDVKSNGAEIRIPTDASEWYYTFIGTGISLSNDVYNFAGSGDNWTIEIDGVSILASTTSGSVAVNSTFAQNLPYGTHILHIKRTAGTASFEHSEVTFHQPKMPPIPEDAVIISDYMLMADYVANATAGLSNISKGVRRVGASRDVFYDQASGSWSIVNVTVPQAFHSPFTESSTSAIAKSFKLPFFGNGLERPFTGHSNKTATITPQFSVAGAAFANANAVSPSLTITSSSNSGTNAYNSSTNVLSQNVGSNDSAQFVSYGNNLTLGVNEYKESSSASGYLNNSCLDIVSPVHSSSHYQSFETPFLHELVGGDRNMEQNNLVVTPDGKSWDEVTRDTSYIGNMVLNISKDSGNVAENTVVVFDEILGFGTTASKISHFYKDFAIAYDRQICLVDGQYIISYMTNSGADVTDRASIYVNGLLVFDSYTNDTSHWNAIGGSISFNLKRGDYVQIKGGWFSSNSSTQYSSYHIERV